jgi:hypothetical protein
MSARRSWLAALVLVASAKLALAHEPTLSRFNYREHVRPIFVAHCGGCHRSGGVAPMSLLDYQEAVPWANAIKIQLLERRMPPFLPDDESVSFGHARGLSASELDILVDWAVGATPEGAPLEAPESDASPSSFTSGRPDLLLEPDGEIVLGKDESEKTVCVVLPTGLTRSRVATGFEVVPGQPTLLRRATILEGDSCAEGEPVETWLPDQGRSSFPPGLGHELRASSSLALELRYVKGWNDEGKTIRDKTVLGIWFSEDAAAVDSVRIGSGRTLDRAVELVALYPDATFSHEPKEPLQVDALLPDGTTRLLLSISAYDRDWREKYVLDPIVDLVPGTRIRSSQPSVWMDLLSRTPRAAE